MGCYFLFYNVKKMEDFPEILEFDVELAFLFPSSIPRIPPSHLGRHFAALASIQTAKHLRAMRAVVSQTPVAIQ